jgi:hypothetical protein
VNTLVFEVLVNGIIEKQKRKKRVAGEPIELNGEIFQLKLGLIKTFNRNGPPFGPFQTLFK